MSIIIPLSGLRVGYLDDLSYVADGYIKNRNFKRHNWIIFMSFTKCQSLKILKPVTYFLAAINWSIIRNISYIDLQS